jgi:hypothetical protein
MVFRFLQDFCLGFIGHERDCELEISDKPDVYADTPWYWKDVPH